MEQFLEKLTSINDAVNSFAWGWFGLILLLGTGLICTCITKAFQITHLPHWWRKTIGSVFSKDAHKKNEVGAVSQFQALCTALAATIGTGNIAGVAAAICVGGPGAVFWMWVAALLGMMTNYSENILGIYFRRKNAENEWSGGPMYYLRDGLGSYKGMKTVGKVLAVIFAACILGGAKKLINVTGALVPVMGILYVVVSLVVLVMNAKNLGAMFGMIFSNAFDFQAIFGGFAGSCIMLGFKRGLYSNEAGMGSAPNAAAKADVAHPVKQGLVQSLSVFIDTLLICTATAFMTLSTVGVSPADFNTADGVQAAGYVQACLHETLGGFGPIFIAVSMSLFAFTTLIGNYSYCEGCLAFILKRDLTKTEALIFRIIASLVVFAGPIATASLAWNTADMMQGLMVLTNIPSILILSGVACKALKDYTDQKKAGKEPVFKAANIGLDESKVDCWK